MSEVFHFKIGWKFPKTKPMVADYAAANLRELLRLLEDSEGVTTATTEYLYIHQILPFGGVKEVLAHDKDKGSLSVDFSTSGSIKRAEYKQEHSEQHSVVTKVGELLASVAEKKSKPRLKLKSNGSVVPVKRSYLYTASEAGHET